MLKSIGWKWYHYLRAMAIISTLKINDDIDLMVFFLKLQKKWKVCLSLQKQYQNFLTKHPDGRISRGSFHDMMKVKGPLVWNIQVAYSFQNDQFNLLKRRNAILGLTRKSLSVTYFACMIQTRWVPSMCNAELNNCLEEKNIFNAIECCYHLAEAK